MDAATLQARIYSGYAKVALRMGQDYQVWRPAQAANPFTNQIAAALKAGFNNEDMGYGKPNKYGDPLWFGLFDGSLTLPGDYLVRPGAGVNFIAAQQLHLPILIVSCNRVIRIERPAPKPVKVGAVGYRGAETTTASGMVDVLGSSTGAALDMNFVLNNSTLQTVTGWPCSLLRGKGGSGQGQPDRLPLGVSQAGWDILLPVSAPITISPSDFVIDDLGRRYQVGSAELSDLGWRVSAMEVHT